MSTSTNHFNNINKRILWLTDRIAWCQVNDKPFNLFIRERESLIWLEDKVKELALRLLKLSEPESDNELIRLRSKVDQLESIKAKLTQDLLKERDKRKKELPKIIGCYFCSDISCLYMVKDDVWFKAWPSYSKDKAANRGKVMEMCFNCLENKLGRPLTIDDFTNAPVNEGIRLGFEMGLDYTLQRVKVTK